MENESKPRTRKQEVNRREETETLLKELREVEGIEMFELVGGFEGKSVFPPFLWPPITGHAVLQLSPE